MNDIKYIHKIKEYLTNEQLEKLEYSAFLHRRHAHILFKISIFNPDEKIIRIEVKQEKNPNGVFADTKRLIEIVEETFREYFTDFQIQKSVFPYIPAPAEIVTPEWAKKQMQKYKVGNKQLCKHFGIAKAEISAMINGHREMGIRTKGLFYYYFMNYDDELKKEFFKSLLV